MDKQFKETNLPSLLLDYLYKTTEISSSQTARLELIDRAVEQIVTKLSNGINSKIDKLGLRCEEVYGLMLVIKSLEERQTKLEAEKIIQEGVKKGAKEALITSGEEPEIYSETNYLADTRHVENIQRPSLRGAERRGNL